jgi:hypothetical protein
MSKKIMLGDRVKDVVTGFAGIVIAETVWLNGCVRYAVQSDKLKDGVPTESVWIDKQQLKIVGKKVELPLQDTGGPCPAPQRHKDSIRR